MDAIGQELRRGRETLELSIEEISQATRIPVRSLRLLEEGRFDVLPPDVFTRGFVRAYAREVGLDAIALVGRFDAESRGARNVRTSVVPVGRQDGGRRIGFAVAVAILLILFSLALSVVLRPRHSDAPVELSSGPASSAARTTSDA